MKQKSLVVFGSLLAATAIAVAASSGSSTFDSFVKKVSEAQSMDVAYTITQVGGASADYRVTLQRPNKARIETPSRIVVANGETMTVFLPGQNVYYEKPQNDDEVKAFLSEASNGIWALFFDSKAYANAAKVRNEANRRIRGVDMRTVRIQEDAKGDYITTLFLDDKNLVRQASMEATFSGQKNTQLLQTTKFNLNGDVAGDVFAFAAPTTAKKVNEADLVANKWFTNLDEAKEAARLVNKPLLVGFTATWCGPCQMLKREVYPTAEFKEAAKNFVLVSIDIDQQPNVAERFGVSGIPHIIFMDVNEKVLNSFVGFRPAPAYVAEMRKAAAAQ